MLILSLFDCHLMIELFKLILATIVTGRMTSILSEFLLFNHLIDLLLLTLHQPDNLIISVFQFSDVLAHKFLLFDLGTLGP